MYEGGPNHPEPDRFLEYLIEPAIHVNDFLHGADGDPRFMRWAMIT